EMARSGREAIEKYEEFRPNLVLMDIQMPGINGIEAIRSIKEQNPHVKCVIISAYEHFDYAKQAVELGVKEYILKPINKNKLVDIVTKVIKEIEDEKRMKQKEIENKEKMDKILPVLEHGLIYSILMNNDFKNEIENYYGLFDIDNGQGYMMVIEFGEGLKAGKVRNKIGTGVKSQIYYENVRNTIKHKCRCIVGPIIINRITILVHEDKIDNEYEQRLKAIALAESIKSSIDKIIDSQMFIGIGSCFNIHEINHSYDEALKAISKIDGEEILHIKDAVETVDIELRNKMMNIKNNQDNIVTKMEEGNVHDVEQLLQDFFAKLGKEYKQTESEVKNTIMELLVLIYASAYRNNVMSESFSYRTYLSEIQKMDNFYELKSWCFSKILSITEKIKEEKETKVSNIISEAKKYIDENYNKEIGLTETSEAVSISPQYFSKIFKEELGLNFIEYLTNLRMEHAKRMLKEKKLSIKEICYEIGYNDPNYFSRLFKKNEGISPTEYY
ncbi:MAG: response regulator, partial [Vallitaleaceae bacterium]|nr:response regulator [Vallitaleaceae bacterium]